MPLLQNYGNVSTFRMSKNSKSRGSCLPRPNYLSCRASIAALCSLRHLLNKYTIAPTLIAISKTAHQHTKLSLSKFHTPEQVMITSISHTRRPSIFAKNAISILFLSLIIFWIKRWTNHR